MKLLCDPLRVPIVQKEEASLRPKRKEKENEIENSVGRMVLNASLCLTKKKKRSGLLFVRSKPVNASLCLTKKNIGVGGGNIGKWGKKKKNRRLFHSQKKRK